MDEKIFDEAEVIEEPEVTEEANNIEEPEVIEKKQNIDEIKVEEKRNKKVKGFGVCKFTLSFMMMLFTCIASVTLIFDMFIMHYEQSAVNEQSYIEYIKGTDIFYMINYFGDFLYDEKVFVITAIICMIVTIGIGIVQFFLIMLWRTKAGYVVVMFTSVIAIVSEVIMIVIFLEKYVQSQYDAMGMVGYGPMIAIAAHIFIIMLASVTRKLTKINSIVNH
ncbi:MAG: hypothetical protein E7270_06945 [Lachnospiraceae bacterium]|nr:hypothetical protein [Lachnospiraceae bacterium]